MPECLGDRAPARAQVRNQTDGASSEDNRRPLSSLGSLRRVLTLIRLPYFDLAKGLVNIGGRDPRASISSYFPADGLARPTTLQGLRRLEPSRRRALDEIGFHPYTIQHGWRMDGKRW